ncbi:MAG: hypothetical protein LBL90_05225 [Prevotellaceae bacterium]|nr:hypothetical protein [Prevotellaceae bacterium]
MKYINTKLFLIVIICLLSGYSFAQKIPFVNNIQQYNIKEGDVAKMQVNVYSIRNDDGVVRTNMLADYAVEISFDTLRNRVKEIIYSASGEKLHTNTWDYNIANETVGQYKLDNDNYEIAKKITQSNAKAKTVNLRKYGSGDTLLVEENWMVGATGKTINLDRYVWDIYRGIIGKKTSKSFDIKDGKSIEHLITELGDLDDYSWLPNFINDWNLARNKESRDTRLTDGTQILYIYDKKKDLMTEKKYINSKGEVMRKIDYEYEFDGNGNWTKLTQYSNNQPNTIVTRTFEFRVKPIVVRKKK